MEPKPFYIKYHFMMINKEQSWKHQHFLRQVPCSTFHRLLPEAKFIMASHMSVPHSHFPFCCDNHKRQSKHHACDLLWCISRFTLFNKGRNQNQEVISEHYHWPYTQLWCVMHRHGCSVHINTLGILAVDSHCGCCTVQVSYCNCLRITVCLYLIQRMGLSTYILKL